MLNIYMLTTLITVFTSSLFPISTPPSYSVNLFLVDPMTTDEQIEEENRLGDMELVAQLCQAEAGNQDLGGMRLVADVVYNRVENPKFPNTVEEVIFQDYQFSVILNGSFDKAGWKISDEAFKASELEYNSSDRIDPEILYFNNSENVFGKNPWKFKDHWFAY